MSKHLADHRKPSDGSRLKQFIRIAHDRSEAVWQMVKQRPRHLGDANPRAVQFARIERGRQV